MVRRGAALIGAVLAIICVTALLAAVALATREAQVTAATARNAQHTFTAAERAAWTAASAIDEADVARAIGSPRPLLLVPGSADTIESSVTRIAPRLFLAVGRGGVRTTGGGHLWRRIGIFIRATADSLGAHSFAPLPQRHWAELP